VLVRSQGSDPKKSQTLDTVDINDNDNDHISSSDNDNYDEDEDEGFKSRRRHYSHKKKPKSSFLAKSLGKTCLFRFEGVKPPPALTIISVQMRESFQILTRPTPMTIWWTPSACHQSQSQSLSNLNQTSLPWTPRQRLLTTMTALTKILQWFPPLLSATSSRNS